MGKILECAEKGPANAKLKSVGRLHKPWGVEQDEFEV